MLTLNDGRSELWQWDTGRKLNVDADCSQVHFSNKVFGRSIDVYVIDGIAIVPDILLQTDKDLNVWAFVGTAENGYTKISKTFKVNRRNKPADYVFTPPDQTSLEEIKERIDALEEKQDPDAIKNAVDDYLSNNPIQIDEKDPTVPDWAKQTSKPKYTAKEVGAVATVNGISPDESGNVQIKVPDSVEGAVLYTEQELTEEQKAQARENIGAIPEDAVVSLSPKQINALDALFKVASYTEDVSEAYAEFRRAFGIGEPDAPSEEETTEVAYIIHNSVTSLNDASLALYQHENKSRAMMYSATKQERVFAEHNGTMWDESELSPIKIPVGAVTANVVVPSEMKYGAFIAEPHDTDSSLVKGIVDSGWVTDGRATDVSGYNDGNYYFAVNLAYTSNAEFPADFDTSVIDFYFADANGNRMP